MSFLSCATRCAAVSAGWIVAVALQLVALPMGAATAEAQSPERLKTLTIEELLEIDVTSVSRRSERIAEAAAAIDVITGDEIRRAGVTTLVEALRLLTGLAVARASGGTWAISARGFNLTSANKLLVLIDGRSVYTPLFSGVFWDMQDTALEEIDRIEVIRGPGATLWGANAVNGVINVITKAAVRTINGLVELGAGSEERGFGTLRYGDELGRMAYRVYAKYNYLDANRIQTGESARDALRRGQVGGRVDWSFSKITSISLIGDGYTGSVGQFDRPDTDFHGWNLLGRVRRHVSPDAELQLQGYYDRTFRSIPALFEENRGTWDVEAQYRARRYVRHSFLVGGGYRLTRDETRVPMEPGLPPGAVALFEPAARSTPLISAFVQDEIELQPQRAYLTLGARMEHNDYTGFELQPTVRARWSFRPRSLLWGAISRAVRTPTRLDADVRFVGPDGSVFLRGGDGFESESVAAFEAGYRVQPVTRVSIDVAGFHNRYDRLRSQEPGAPVVLANGLRGRTRGLETEVTVRPAEWIRLQGAWTLFGKTLQLRPGSRDATGGAPEGNDPRTQFTLQTTMNLPRRIEVDGYFRRIGRLPQPPVPAYSELDLVAGWWITPDLTVSVVGRNLLHDRHPEFGAAQPRRIELERSVYGRVRVLF